MNEEENQDNRLAAFDTGTLLRAVDDLDMMREHLDGDGHNPPEFRADLLRLHQLAMKVVNEGCADRATNEEMFDLAMDLECRIDDLSDALDGMRESIGGLAALSPDEEPRAD